MGFAALGGPCRAPGHTLTPEVLRPKQLLHLLPSDLNAGLSHYQACEERQKGWKGREEIEKACEKRGQGWENEIWERGKKGGKIKGKGRK